MPQDFDQVLSVPGPGMDQWRLTILGEGAVGKTALAVQFSMNAFVETYDPTIEDSYRKTVVVDGKQAFLEVIDTAGQDEYATLRDQWVREGQGFMLVYSVTSRKSFNRLQEFYNAVVDGKQAMASSSSNRPKYSRPGIVVVGNKIDLEDEREVLTKEGERLAQVWDCGFIETSAMQATFVDQSFCELIRQCRRAGPVDGLPPQLLGPPLHKASNPSMNGQAPASTGQNTFSSLSRSFATTTPQPPPANASKPTIRLRRRKRLEMCIIA